GTPENGTIHEVSWDVIEKLINSRDLAAYRSSLYREATDQDAQRFGNLETLTAKVKVLAERKKQISDQLIGVFYEDINYAADGGIYGELIQIRDFEYHPLERKNNDPNWNALTAWEVLTDHKIDSTQPIHKNNKHYLVLQPKNSGALVRNLGYDGISVKGGEKYDLSLFVKEIEGDNVLQISLKDRQGTSYGTTQIRVKGTSWKKHKAVIKTKSAGDELFLEIQLQKPSSIALDMISLFPRNTFNN